MSVWIRVNERPTTTSFYYFKKTFTAKNGAQLDFNVSADTRYQLYINGNLICEGPCQGAAHQRHYETASVKDAIIDGENEITVKVQYVAGGTFHIVYRLDHPALWFDGVLTQDGENTPIVSDQSWICLRDDGVKFNHFMGIHPSMPPCEEWAAEEKLTPVDISNWFDPLVNTHGFTPWGTIMPYSLYKRPIPQMKEHEKRVLTPVKKGEGYIIYDAGEYTTAKVYLNVISTPKDGEIKLTYAESVSFGEPVGAQARDKRIRDDINAEGARIDGVQDVIHTGGEKQSFNTFWFRAFRYIKLELPENTECTLSYAPYFYPFDDAGRFACSNESYNRMWHVSLNTLLCCTHETYVDCPYYEQGQYSMDGALEMLYTFRTSTDTAMPLKIVNDLAASQIHDGMICANYPSSVTQVIPDFTLFWVMMANNYLHYTGDVENVKPLMGTIDKALEAFENLKTEDGLIGPTQYWHYVDWVPGWKRGVPPGGDTSPLTVTCLLYATALRSASELCANLGKTIRAKEYLARAEEMNAAVNKYLYDQEKGLYFDSLESHTFSQHTSVWAILSGAVTGDEAGKLADRTFGDAAGLPRCSFSMNHYLFRALEMADRYCYATKLLEGWEKMLDLHCTTWCENPDSPRSECHAWSSAPIYEFSAMALGVCPTSGGYDTVRIKPNVKDLDLNWAKGTVPTRHGIIAVDWAIEGGSFNMTVTLPEGIKAEVILPDGQTENCIVGNHTFQCEI